MPTDANFKAPKNAKLFGPYGGRFTVTNIKTLTITYTRTMNFLFFTGPTITLTRSKQVYTVT